MPWISLGRSVVRLPGQCCLSNVETLMLENRKTALRSLSIVICMFIVASVEAADDATAVIQFKQNDTPVVGVYYYPWYRRPVEWRRVMRQHLKEPQEPKVGLYRSDDPNVVAEHIAMPF